MPSKGKHPVVPATSANCEKDHQNKLHLNDEFDEFKKEFERVVSSSASVQELVIPLEKLESAINIGAHGFHLVVKPPKKKRRS